MAKGGYQIIDFSGYTLSETPVTIKGAFKKATAGKAVLCENVNGLTSFGVALSAADDVVDISTTLGILDEGTPSVVTQIIEITNEDAVTISAAPLTVAE
jgi:hypothetical protein